MRCIHFGSYWMGKNDIVYSMLSDLRKTCEPVEVDVGIYDKPLKTKTKWFKEDFSHSKAYPVRYLDHDKVAQLINSEKPEFVICNAGGLAFSPDTFRLLRKQKIVSVGISLSDPDVFEDQGRNYARQFDLFFTNSLYSLQHQYNNWKNVSLMPFAASTDIHKPLNVEKRYDVVVVGHARPDRLALVGELRSKFKFGLFGKGWPEGQGEVQGKKQVAAINQGKIYLSFSQTIAGYSNVKVGMFEAAACRSCIITPSLPELAKYFTFGTDLVGLSSVDELEGALDFYLHHDRLRQWLAGNVYERFLAEHTWVHRWKRVINQIQAVKKKWGEV